jgi:hypothetical protein
LVSRIITMTLITDPHNLLQLELPHLPTIGLGPDPSFSDDHYEILQMIEVGREGKKKVWGKRDGKGGGNLR